MKLFSARVNPIGSVFSSSPLLVAGFGMLLALMIGAGVATRTQSERLYEHLSDLNRQYRVNWRSLDEVRSGIHVSGLLIRDYLLDPSHSRAREIREELLALRTNTEHHLSRIEKIADPQNRTALESLRSEISTYWDTLDPVFEWTPEEKQANAYSFLRRQVMPRRESVLALAGDLITYMDRTFSQEREAVRISEEQFRTFHIRTVSAAVLIGLTVAILSILRVRALERRAHQQQLRTEAAEDELRRLSQQLTHAQEEERRSISRELHDEVGQMLTGLRMDLRALQKVQRSDPQAFDARIEQTRVLLEQTLQSVRDIAMGLRPSMLDDFGLRAALEWQVRDFERRHEIAVSLVVDAEIDHLPDRYRTNLYRIVQEALTNCAKHASARAVTIRVWHDETKLKVAIEDDGVGLKKREGAGLGLIGIKERIRELGGTLVVESRPDRGTRLAVTLEEVAAGG